MCSRRTRNQRQHRVVEIEHRLPSHGAGGEETAPHETDAALSFSVQAALVVTGVPVPADCIFSIA